jgi:hypothetical protein
MTVRLIAIVEMVWIGVLAVGCASNVGGTDGETHFLCSTDPDCPSDAICVDRTCVRPDGDVGGTLTCDQQTAAASTKIAAALDSAAGNLSCETDDECVIVSGGSVCTHVCRSAVVSTRGAQTVQAAIDDVESGVCAGFDSEGCTILRSPCPSPPSGAACIDGACTNFPPEAWTSFAMEERRGAATSSSSTPPRCVAGEDCTAWKLTPDGMLEKTEGGMESSASLSPADLAAIDGVLRSIAFRRLFDEGGPTCDPAPPGVLVSIQLENEYRMTGMPVTGCALVGPDGNDVMGVYELLRSY